MTLAEATNSLGRTAARSELCRFVTCGRETGLPLARLALRGNRDGNSRNQSLSRLRHRSDAAMVAMVRRYLPDPCRSSHSTAIAIGSCCCHRSEEHTSELQSLRHLV